MSAPDALIGGRYRLVGRVGTGGMGVVWEAWDERLHRPVAVKQLHAHPGLSDAEAELANNRAMREARITARLHHPHAVPVFDVVEHEGQPCLIMQFLPSKSLSALLRERGVLPPAEVARIGAEVASALAAAHRAGIVHRDVKPGNVLMAGDGTARISDFGISHALGDSTLTSTGMVTGTPAFLAPEVARGAKSSFASDVFSLGATLYTALEGSPPFGTDQNPMALLHKVASARVAPPRRSGALTPLLRRMLAADPGARPSMTEVAETLAGLSARRAPVAPVPVAAAASARTPSLPLHTTPASALTSAATPPPLAREPVGPVRSAAPPTEGHRSRGLLVTLAVVLLLALGVLLATLLPGRDNGGSGSLGPSQPTDSQSGTSTPSTAASTQPSASGSSTPVGAPAAPPPSAPPVSPAPTASAPTASAPTASAPTASAPPSSAPPSSPATSPPATSAPPAGAATAAALGQAITDYYALMPGNTDQAWSRMTASYQTNHAGGRAAYQRFWDAIARVSASNVSGTPPGSAQATITYVFRDGRVVQERTAYGLVPEGGILKINSSTVLSSVSQ